METSLSKRGFYMEKEQNAQVVAKRLWKVVRIVLYMLKTTMYKSNLMLDLNLMLKRSNKAIANLFFHRHHHNSSGTGGTNTLYSSLTCRSTATDVITSALIREYEFSCSNSPAYPLGPLYRRKHHKWPAYGSGAAGYDDVSTVASVQRVLEMLGNSNDSAAGESPLVVFPAARQLRVTDSPFPVKDDDHGVGSDFVDKAAEEFIKRFYKDLKLQNKMASGLDSPYYSGWDR